MLALWDMGFPGLVSTSNMGSIYGPLQGLT